MRILITGANGFIAREIIARLTLAGHELIVCIHSHLLENIPYSHCFKIDFAEATNASYWLPYLENIDGVINCVGVFHTVKEKTMWNIHCEAPKALFEACNQLKIKKVIHISALGVDKVQVPYAASKLAAEEFLQSLAIPSTIIRPGLVYGKGSYGGTSLFRGLAGLPFILPLPGRAEQLQQPIHIDDLTLIVEKALSLPGKELLCAVGAEKLSIKKLLIKLRRWLGFKKAYTISIPDRLIQLTAKLGSLIPNAPLSETGIKMMAVDNVASEAQEQLLQNACHFKPRGFTAGLNGMISSVQDRWHARLYFLRPLLRLSIAFLWLYSGIISLLPGILPMSLDLTARASVPLPFQSLIVYFLSAVDILLGLATLLNFKLLITGTLQCLVILFYTVLISFLLPEYWLHPFAPIAKNIPIFIGVLIMMALESER